MKNELLKVVKIGGKLIENETKFSAFLEDFVALEGPKILVHGGGNLATEIAGKLGYKTQMFEGRRITDADSIKVITMVYGGFINKNIVAKLQALQNNAIGLSGADGMSITSKKRPVKEVDFGFVGDVEKVNSKFIDSLLKQDITLVFSAISCTKEGVLLNTNGDSVAAEIAKAMSSIYETELYLCFEKKGVLADTKNEDSVIEEINREKYRELLEGKIINDGMLPKLHNSFHALGNGVKNIFLGDFRLLKKESVYTKITN
ncbi:acetylglutamate kinase [Salegentibacter salarius]|uniref:Acetylglutamate kinase n=1 Tax=Salegentibacter salarius TaxID=435906 RepID=A0A2N0U5G4_9FLAO|nr:acetylglutamate kinase [Salegentibacter salarius]OEY74028.1 acetylglutamate kinase [Salegentibacter salarius]PKD22229.1 acetylglutamate kinase [Salegentibacter salarius]SLJ86161.1 N-acetylglutamate kinase [Salegentibacter salarius]